MRSYFLLSAAAIALLGCASDDAPPPPPSPPAEVVGPLGDRPDLPVDDHVSLDHLAGPVDVVRDKYGRPHIYATNANDALRVEGYFEARDRTLQLEIFRRLSEGRMAEILGNLDSSLIGVDIGFRHIGLARTAKAQYDALPVGGELRDLLDAYSDGVTQAFAKIRSGEVPLPAGIIAIDPSAFTDWTGVDSLAIGRLQTYLLSYDADVDMANQVFFDAARSTFTAADPDPLVAKRAGLERDLVRFAPVDPATTTTGYPMMKSKKPRPHGTAITSKESAARFADLTRGYLAAMKTSRQMMRRAGFGSNNWAIAPSRSANGHAMVASDPHLSLTAPAIFWPVSIDVTAAAGGDASKNLRVGGLAFPGIPGIILGHNEHVAWGATVAGYDVSDAYAEKLTADGGSVTWKGAPVAMETIDEEIKIKGQPPLIYKVHVVPHHGPIVPTVTSNYTIEEPDPAKGAISIRWTGLEATNELSAVLGLLRAKSVDEAKTALDAFGVGAQNWMIADTNGDILWTSHAVVPVRDPMSFQWNALDYTGNLPCLVLPGDGSAEWKGKLPDGLVPFAKNPSAGYISTANNDPIGVSLDNDPTNDTLPDGTPMYLACSFDIGFREGRIHSLIESHKDPLAVEDLQAIQGDHRSGMGARLTPSLVAALDAAAVEQKTPGTHPDLAAIVADPAYDKDAMAKVRGLLDAWSKTGDYSAESGVNPDTNMPLAATGATANQVAASQATLLFNLWMVRFFERVLGDEADKMGVGIDQESKAKAILRLVESDPKTLATYDPATGDSALWDDLTTPAVVESRHERMIRSMLDALSWLAAHGGANLDTLRWGALHTIRFDALVPLYGSLSIPPLGDATYPKGFPRHGDSFNIDASDFAYVGVNDDPDFTYGAGPTQRFVCEMDPAGPKAMNILPGGNIWDATSKHFRDEADLWKKNQTHPVPFVLADVIAAKESRTVVAPR